MSSADRAEASSKTGVGEKGGVHKNNNGEMSMPSADRGGKSGGLVRSTSKKRNQAILAAGGNPLENSRGSGYMNGFFIGDSIGKAVDKGTSANQAKRNRDAATVVHVAKFAICSIIPNRMHRSR